VLRLKITEQIFFAAGATVQSKCLLFLDAFCSQFVKSVLEFCQFASYVHGDLLSKCHGFSYLFIHVSKDCQVTA